MVREHEDLVFISTNGMVQRTGVRGINRYGRASQGVRVMNLREGDEVSAVALVVESSADEENGDGAEPPVTADEVAGVGPDGVVEVAPDEDVDGRRGAVRRRRVDPPSEQSCSSAQFATLR